MSTPAVCNHLITLSLHTSSPVMGVMVNLTSASGLPGRDNFDFSIVCSVDYSGLGWNTPSDSQLRRQYETPKDATINVHFKL